MIQSHNAPEIEAQTNTYTIKGIRHCIVMAAIVWMLSLGDLFRVSKSMMTMAFMLALLVLIVPEVMARTMGYSWPGLKYVCLVSMLLVSGIFLSTVSYHALLISTIPLLFAVQYRRRKLFWIVFALDVVIMAVSGVFAFYNGVCDLNLLLAGGNTYSYYYGIRDELLLHLIPPQSPVYRVLLYQVLPNVLILLAIALIMRNIIERGILAEIRLAEKHWQDERDLTTRLLTEEKLREMAETFYPEVERLGVIVWRLDNLKQINDTFGHAKGDEMLRAMAASLLREKGDNSRVYRLGGITFAMVIDNPEEEKLNRTSEAVIKGLRSRSAGSHIHVASASVTGPGSALLSLINEAISSMNSNDKE